VSLYACSVVSVLVLCAGGGDFDLVLRVVEASDYIDTLFAHAERKFDQWKIAEDATSPLPKGSLREAKMIYKRLFRVYAHLFHSHFELIKNTDTEGPLTVCFKRFVLFIKEFNLVKENELAPMKELIALIVEKKI